MYCSIIRMKYKVIDRKEEKPLNLERRKDQKGLPQLSTT